MPKVVMLFIRLVQNSAAGARSRILTKCRTVFKNSLSVCLVSMWYQYHVWLYASSFFLFFFCGVGGGVGGGGGSPSNQDTALATYAVFTTPGSVGSSVHFLHSTCTACTKTKSKNKIPTACTDACFEEDPPPPPPPPPHKKNPSGWWYKLKQVNYL